MKQLKQLRDEIVLCSLYIKDYNNSFMSTYDALTFFNGYADYLGELMIEKIKDYNDSKYFDYLNEFDNINNLKTYYDIYLIL